MKNNILTFVKCIHVSDGAYLSPVGGLREIVTGAGAGKISLDCETGKISLDCETGDCVTGAGAATGGQTREDRGRQTWPWVGPRPRTCGHRDRSAGDILDRRLPLQGKLSDKRLPWQEIALARDCLDNLEDTTTISKDPLESWQENTVKEDHLKKRFPWQEITWTRVHSKLLTLDDPAGDYCDLMIMSRIPLLWKHVWNCSYSRYKVIFQISSVLYKDKDHCKHYKVYVYCKLQDFPVGRVSGKVSIIRLLQKK